MPEAPSPRVDNPNFLKGGELPPGIAMGDFAADKGGLHKDPAIDNAQRLRPVNEETFSQEAKDAPPLIEQHEIIDSVLDANRQAQQRAQARLEKLKTTGRYQDNLAIADLKNRINQLQDAESKIGHTYKTPEARTNALKERVEQVSIDLSPQARAAHNNQKKKNIRSKTRFGRMLNALESIFS